MPDRTPTAAAGASCGVSPKLFMDSKPRLGLTLQLKPFCPGKREEKASVGRSVVRWLPIHPPSKPNTEPSAPGFRRKIGVL